MSAVYNESPITMLLPYGSKDGLLIHISEVKSGTTDLTCPYCEGALIARKGRVMTHHFAHRATSCLTNNSSYFFALQKDIKLQDSLSSFAEKMQSAITNRQRKLEKECDNIQKRKVKAQQQIRKMFDSLKSLGIDKQEAKIAYQSIQAYVQDEFAPFPDLTGIRHPDLYVYTNGNEEHIPYERIMQKEYTNHYPLYYHQPLLALKSYHPLHYRLKELEEKLRLYAQDWAWFQKFRIYFLKIQIGEYATLYKIGLTSRPLAQRLSEIRYTLSSHYDHVIIDVLYEIKNHAFLEHFFKHKYRKHRYAIDQMTEYFKLEPHEVENICQELEVLIEANGYIDQI